jgi:hypothetical protein
MIAHALLAAWLLATWACIGAVAWRAIHALTGGAWGDAIAGSLQGQRRALPLVAMAGLPWLMAAAYVLPWIHDAPATSRQWYLNYPFLAYRTIGCFVAWSAARWAAARTPSLSLIVWLFGCGVFATDWIASLQPAWRSSAIGLVAAVGQLSVTMSIAALSLCREPEHGPTPAHRRDIAGLLVALCLGWAYLAGIDYLTAWMADLPFETVWYLPRTQGPWAWVAVAAVVFHLVLPCCLLLAGGMHRRGRLSAAAACVLAGETCHLAWMVIP